MSRNEFIKYHHDERFDDIVNNRILPICDILANDKQNKRDYDEYIRRKRLSDVHRRMAINKPKRPKRF